MNALIIEDESAAARGLKLILSEVAPEITVKAVLETITETIEWFSANPKPDVVFMDIHLADGSAFEIFNRISITSPIIFTTAYDEYALKAFKVNSIDYLVKPIDTAGVKNALDKLKSLSAPRDLNMAIQKMLEEMGGKKKAYQKNFLIPVSGDKLFPLSVDDIAYININNGVVRSTLLNRKSCTMGNTLDELAEMLDPADFFRANRQYIVARKAIVDIDLWFGGKLSVNLVIPAAEKIIISKTRVPEFKKWFSNI